MYKILIEADLAELCAYQALLVVIGCQSPSLKKALGTEWISCMIASKDAALAYLLRYWFIELSLIFPKLSMEEGKIVIRQWMIFTHETDT